MKGSRMHYSFKAEFNLAISHAVYALRASVRDFAGR
jgi:hypothetical protein